MSLRAVKAIVVLAARGDAVAEADAALLDRVAGEPGMFAVAVARGLYEAAGEVTATDLPGVQAALASPDPEWAGFSPFRDGAGLPRPFGPGDAVFADGVAHVLDMGGRFRRVETPGMTVGDLPVAGGGRVGDLDGTRGRPDMEAVPPEAVSELFVRLRNDRGLAGLLSPDDTLVRRRRVAEITREVASGHGTDPRALAARLAVMVTARDEAAPSMRP